MAKALRRNAIYGAVILLMVMVIAWGALQAAPPIPKLFSWQDKVEHFLAFSGLTLWLTALLRPSRIWIAAGLATLGAIVLEVAQTTLTSTRSGSVDDLLASIAGVVLAMAFVMFARHLSPVRSLKAA